MVQPRHCVHSEPFFLAAAAISEKLGRIDEALNAAIVLVAVVNVTATPLGLLRSFPARRVQLAPAVVTDTGLAARD